ncbi:MAG: hypothetical protein ACP5GX_07470 [Anaerolineae bacterium]
MCSGELLFDIDVTGLSNGIYTGYIDVDGGAAGSQTIEIRVKVVDEVFGVSIPVIMAK